MASSLHNLSDYNVHSVPDATGMRVGIVVSEWNEKITGALLDGACKTLVKHGVREESINIKTVPGSFELVYGAARFVSSGLVDVVIAIGCVIRGDTPHFDYICQGVTQGLADLNKEGKIPVIYGLLTCNTLEQAQERCGGMLGNKGDECAVTAIKMVKGWE
ncbi:MAG: 6,7-dimethyl-8-ribityllumazine synthase [Bacteroidaceae bacterium]|jgi:6,7-dimethyl-8-ribityllumazine synthase|nr:6,7-dimethyl-8-ribityllumazine synthase [Bacteroidaceae bacterium]MBQ5621623.1 6,7-dimethyl-8-ribityllumazine synthase [Bacteroidaceae bacterium]MBR0543707.1 6,7-dimethyl-8-ribityllumazine synthase [Bacteroidaceae bacterium]MEE1004273.1 6,7-dimethyl-8-ribityllumazine synthase [Bacteroidaceae bacterium]MEE1308659.1 6,7-dimethyl-8-ribityllumazine synthase [Bacteroidaceae bacterium]